MNTTTDEVPKAALDQAMAARVVLKTRGAETGGFFISADGHIVASLHAVSGESEITAVLPGGWELPVTGVTAIDPRRDLAILKVDGQGFPALAIAHPAAASEDDDVFVFPNRRGGLSSERVGTVHVLDKGLQLFELHGALPEEANGSPVLNGDGHAVGFVTAGRGPEGSTVATPLKHVMPLIHDGPGNSLRVLQSVHQRRQVERDVPVHPVELLNGCDAAAVQQIVLALAKAIRAGAPLYNAGNIEGCVKVYEAAAQRICDEHKTDARSIVAALRVGLTRAATLELTDQKAWALRDAFDGVLDVARRYFQTQQMPTRPATGAKYLN